RASSARQCSPLSSSVYSSFLTSPPPPRSTLFPYTTLFRSRAQGADRRSCGRQHVLPAHREAAGEGRGARGGAGCGSPRQRRPEGDRFGHGRSPRAGRAMSSRLVPLLIGAGVLVVLAALSLFSVSETEFAIRTEFGAIVGIHYAPGLHLKWPWDV